MMSTKNTALIIAPCLDQYNAALKEITFANKAINLEYKKVF